MQSLQVLNNILRNKLCSIYSVIHDCQTEEQLHALVDITSGKKVSHDFNYIVLTT